MTDKDLKFASEETLQARIKPLVEYWHNVKAKENDKYRWYNDTHISYGNGMRCTQGNKVFMTFYNVDFKASGMLYCQVDAIVDPETLDYTIKGIAGYGNFTSVTPVDDGPVFKRTELSEEDRIEFDALTANSLYLHQYSIHKSGHPIIDKRTQSAVFNHIALDSFDEC